jgi:CHAT domain-containing protein
MRSRQRHPIDCVWIVGLSTLLLVLAPWWPSVADPISKPNSAGKTQAAVSALLDNEKPNPDRVAGEATLADAVAPANANATFYYGRAEVRASLGRMAEAIADANKAVELSSDPLSEDVFHYRQLLIIELSAAGAFKQSNDLLGRMTADYGAPRFAGRMFYVYRWQAQNSLNAGYIAEAERALQRLKDLQAKSLTWHDVDRYRPAWDRNVAEIEARLLDAHGHYRAAELAYRKVLSLDDALAAEQATDADPVARNQLPRGRDFDLSFLATAIAQQGRLRAAEVNARLALLDWLKQVGKYNADTVHFVRVLASIVNEEGRYGEAEKLIGNGIDILKAIGMSESSRPVVFALQHLAATFGMHQRWMQASKVYARIDRAVVGWDAAQVALLDWDAYRVYSDYVTERIPEGLELARRNLARSERAYGATHFKTALARSMLAIGLSRAGEDAEALREFETAVPVLFSGSHENVDEQSNLLVAHDARLRNVIEAYLGVLARTGKAGDPSLTEETFRLSELTRNEAVQRALSASSIRSLAGDPALADLARRAQDLALQLQAALGNLNANLSLPEGERDPAVIAGLNEEITKLRADRLAANEEIGHRFPRYASLIDPRPPSIDDVRAHLDDDEALISIHLGVHESFVWAIPKSGSVAFASVPATLTDIRERVGKLRLSLEPQASDVAQVPPFDVAGAYELYELLLKPVEPTWWPAKRLIIEANDSLSTLPLSLLPTEPPNLMPADKRFAEYRSVDWLARSHAVTVVPTAASFVTIRQLPPRSPNRERFVGFGDPFFSSDQLSEAASSPVSSGAVQVSGATMGALRGIPLIRRAPSDDDADGIELGDLPRLPDTAEELRAIATALGVDPALTLHLGKDANEQTVKSTDLAHYRIVAFATHGLRAGELSGLEEPALALSAPAVAGVEGDGLLTVDKILGLKLDADWVVLSACNTGAAKGAGAEAASGLGRAFFYAGTQALLVTNWSVHSASARQLVADLFRRAAADSSLSRSEALRQAMMALLDGPGFTDSAGKTVFTYAHPLFWAPYSIIGDGGR